jgi:hypothetical protein
MVGIRKLLGLKEKELPDHLILGQAQTPPPAQQVPDQSRPVSPDFLIDTHPTPNQQPPEDMCTCGCGCDKSECEDNAPCCDDCKLDTCKECECDCGCSEFDCGNDGEDNTECCEDCTCEKCGPKEVELKNPGFTYVTIYAHRGDPDNDVCMIKCSKCSWKFDKENENFEDDDHLDVLMLVHELIEKVVNEDVGPKSFQQSLNDLQSKVEDIV